MRLISTLAGLVLAVGFTATAAADTLNEINVYETPSVGETWTLLAEGDLQVNHVGSRLVDPPLHLDAEELDLTEIWVHLEDYSRTESCYSYANKIYVTQTSDQENFAVLYPNSTGDFVLPTRGGLEWVQFNVFSQALGRCKVQLFGRNDGTQPDPGEGEEGEYEFLGVIEYLGGYQGDITLPLDTPETVTKLWLRVPEFCADVDILDLGTITEGVFDRATLIDAEERIYLVDGSEEGRRIASVKGFFNGPRELACDIPVYGLIAE